ncbi:peptidyl-glycine alpha-amidating monooxygenase-like [Actinia tenebrosa]|uniref:Peptidyl-glycine alpha-amidating monooxygenase-like n=1 Tax=Actinia tenebrosa TaxID=6105 RepID=A0A6P8J304_ACTTE|nr:peptidyl-glycine alpha-amidating monooxygenase-like [Actinia tenebrosa]
MMNSKGECCRRYVRSTVAIMVAVLVIVVQGRESSSIITTLPVRMPGTMASTDNAYLCTSVKLHEREEYVVRFEPKASQDVAHHMLLFGCSHPGSNGKIWDCSEMKGMECSGKEKILFAWAKDAPAKDLPKGVAFKVGKSSGINYLVLQVHYKHKAKAGVKDHSGFILHTTLQRQPFIAGIFLLWSANTDIAPEANGVHSDIGCIFDDETPIYAFAYRTHAHALGSLISGYKVHRQNWTLLGKKSPQEPQAFYPMNKVVKITKGDKLAARCTYDAKGHHLTKHVNIGSSGKDEMCNFYIMYYQDASLHDIDNDVCSDMDLKGLTLNFPKDSKSTSSKPQTPISKSRPSSEAVVNNNHDNDSNDSFSHSKTLKEEYDLVKDWPKLGKETLGQVSGVALDSIGNVILFHRGKRTWDVNSFDDQHNFNGQNPIREHTVLTLNPISGRVISRWGNNMFYLPHGITVDHSDNIWLTDIAMHQVLKYPPKGDDMPLLSVGEMFVPGSDDNHFCQPTDVAVENSGVFYVADGYCNSRIMKFSSKGKMLAKWSEKGYLSLNIPHSLALDEINQRLYIADRENGRIQHVDTITGQFGQPITKQPFGLIYAVNFNNHNGLLYAVNGNSVESNLPVKGFTLKNGLILNSWPSDRQHFRHPHDVVCSSDGNFIFVVETEPNKVWKLSRRGQSRLNKESTLDGEIRGDKPKEDIETKTWTSTKETLPERCTYSSETGPCRAAIQRWYYDINKRRCMHFIYGGCQGNENNFKSVKDCQDTCASKGHSNQSKHFSRPKPGEQNQKTVLKELSSNDDKLFKENMTMAKSKGRPQQKPEIHDDWENAAGEDEGEESNLHVWKSHSNTSNTTISTPYHIQDNQSTSTDDIQAGMMPALIILSVLAVPIIFLLLISIVLRIRAYRRERRYNLNRLLNKDGLPVDRTVGWWSYLNCCSKRKYGFDKVNLAEFYSDSESDGV